MNFEEFQTRYQNVPVEEYPNRVLDAVPEPMVSVKISTYQHADFIRDCLDGVLMQETDFPIEILIGEDASSDGTREICKAYADRHPDKIRLFLHRRENNIAIHGRPTGKFQSTYTRFMCRGKYIALCEGDDYWTDPLKLQKQVDLLETSPRFAGCFHKTADIENKTGEIRKIRAASTATTVSAEDTITISTHFHTSSFVFRVEELTAPIWSTRFLSGDMILFSMVAKQGPLIKIDDIMSVRRSHENGISQSDQHIINFHRDRIDLMKELNSMHNRKYSRQLRKVVRHHQIMGEFGRHYWVQYLKNIIAFRTRFTKFVKLFR